MKTLNFHLFPGIVLLIALTSCHKDETPTTTIVEGHVREFGTGKPLTNAKVSLYGASQGSFSWYGSSGPVSTYLSDSKDGYYSVSYHEKGSMTVMAEKDRYEKNGYFPTDMFDVPEGRKTTLDIYLYPNAWLKLYVKNTAPFDDNDKIASNFGYGWETQELKGKEIDKFYGYPAYGNTDLVIKYSVTKNGQTKDFQVSVFCPGHDTTSYTIAY
jgi:hypothetical protein